MLRWTMIVLVLAAAAATAAWMRLGCPPDRTGEVMRLAPNLDPVLARHLALDDEEGFRRYCRAAGVLVIKDALIRIDGAIYNTSVESFSPSWDRALPYLLRLAQGLAHEFECPGYLRDLQFRAGLAPEARWRLLRLHTEQGRLWADRAIPPAKKLAAHEAFMAQLRALGNERGIMMWELAAAYEVTKLGDLEQRLVHVRRALGIARTQGETYMACQILGELGATFEAMGQRDSMLVYYDEARRIAERCRFPDHYARILSFCASDLANQGRLGTATDLIVEAQRVCRELGGGQAELRFLVAAMNLFANLGCWEIHERLLRRAPVLIREARGHLAAAPWPLDVECQRARALFARGETDAADQLMRRIRGRTNMSDRSRYAGLLDQWSAGLVEAGRVAEALPLVEEGLAYSDSLYVDEYAAGLALRRAQVLHALGRLDQAAAALDDFDRRRRPSDRPYEPLAIAAATLRARLLYARGDRLAARSVVEKAFARLRDHARRLDHAPQGYLSLASFQGLRLAAHDILATDAESGYRVERAWRSVMGDLGRERHGVPPTAGAASSSAHPRRGAGVSRVDLPPRGTWHFVYLVRPQAIVRWTATAHGVRCDTLALDPEDCGRRIRAVVESMARQRHGDPLPDRRGLESDLHDLACLLLPPEILATSGRVPPPVLYVTPDGPLGLLPFEALNLARDGYEALAQRFDVAYARESGDGEAPLATGPPSILSDPLTSQEFRRRFPHADSLPASDPEASLVLRAWPRARLFRGAAATKRAVVDSWSRAPRIHVAAHLVRDPEIPFIAFIPMATATGTTPDDKAYLELADIRALDLRGCELVVLSGCASGAPYLTSRSVGPSMGDGFLDAGAGAVVQTFWEIEDQDAQHFVAGFLRQLGAGPTDPVRALSAARREVIGASRPPPGPADWAVWSVGLRHVPARNGSTLRLASSLAR